MKNHIPHLKTINEFYQTLRIGIPQSDNFAIMRIEDQPPSKLAEMPLFRCNFYRVVFFTNTGVTFNLPNQAFDITENSIYFSYPGKLESWFTTQKISGYLVCFTETFAHIDALQATFQQAFPFFNFTGQSLITFSNQKAKTLKNTLDLMLWEYKLPHTDQKEMLRFLLNQYLIQVRRVYDEVEKSQSTELQNSHTIFNKFEKAMNDYFAQLANNTEDRQISVSAIAQQIFLNPSYLNTVIKNLTGKTASIHLQEKTILEAKSYLLHTNLQVAEISLQLGFTNVTYFNRFFKKITNQTPLQFKKVNR